MKQGIQRQTAQGSREDPRHCYILDTSLILPVLPSLACWLQLSLALPAEHLCSRQRIGKGKPVTTNVSHTFMSNSLQLHGLQATRLLCPQSSPGKNTRIGSHFLIQGIVPTQGLKLGLLHYRQMLYHLSCQGSPEKSLPFLKASSEFSSHYPIMSFSHLYIQGIRENMFYFNYLQWHTHATEKKE